MAFISVIIPHRKIYTQYMLHGYGRAKDDAEFRFGLRMTAAVLLSWWYDEAVLLAEKDDPNRPNLEGSRGHVFDVATNEHFYTKGFGKTQNGNDERLWFCSYIGFEKVTSEWAKKNYPDCNGYICMRIYNQDSRHNELESHTVQIYF